MEPRPDHRQLQEQRRKKTTRTLLIAGAVIVGTIVTLHLTGVVGP